MSSGDAHTELSADEAGRRAEEQERAVVLVADDEPVSLALMKRRLERENFRVVVALDGREAIERAREWAPALMILDVMMPVLDGLQACRALKENPATRDIPVIFLSALDHAPSSLDGFPPGAHDYLSKPFGVEELIARVHVALRLKRERDALRHSAEESWRQAEAAREMSMADALTGLRNRLGLQRALQRAFAEARRYARPLSCLMIDVDRFKEVNDTYTHGAGDAVLAQAARVLTESVRGSDVVCRYGGDEFVVIMPQTPLEGALALGEKIRLAASAHPFGEGGRVISLTFSIGAAELLPDESDRDMLARADAALYEAKAAGRDRTASAHR